MPDVPHCQSHPQANSSRYQERSRTASGIALLTRFDAADLTATCLRTIDEAIAAGDLEIVRIGRSVRIRPIALERFIEARTTRCNPRRARKTTARKAATPA